MLQRGRKSADVVGFSGLSVVDKKKLEPIGLGFEEQKIWNAVVNDNAADYFSETYRPLLEQYCKTVVQIRDLDKLISEMDMRLIMRNGDAMRIYKEMKSLLLSETRVMLALAASLRITKQSISESVAGTSAKGRGKESKPWEDFN